VGFNRGLGVLDGVEIVKGERAVLGVNLGRFIVTNEILCVTGSDAPSQMTLERTWFVYIDCENCK